MSMETNYKVYVHINKINGKRYYGITKQEVKYRWNNGKGYSNNEHFTRAINKYGWDNFEHIVIVRGLTKDEAEWLEIELIREWGTTNDEYGYNITKGGDDNPMDNEEVRKKASESHKGENNHMYGKTHTEEARKKMSEAKKDKYEGEDNPNAKKIFCIELDRYFNTIIEASEYVGCHKTTISKALRKNKTAGDYHWLYAKDVNEENINKVLSKDKPKKVFCVELDKYFDTVKEASKYVGCSDSNISRVLTGKNKTAGDYHWLYAKDVNEENINKVLSEEYNEYKGKPKKIFCVELNRCFNTVKQASEYVSCNPTNISKVLGKSNRTAKGYHWIYAKDRDKLTS